MWRTLHGMRPRHILVVDPAMHTPELDCFNRMAAGAPLPLTYHLPALHGMASIRRDDASAVGIVVLGSASSVNDRLPWQAELGDWLRARMELGVPTLGLCFGHQLIAALFGAHVEFLFADQHKLQGFEPTALAADPLWGESRTSLLYASHREIVTSCPSALTVTATRPVAQFDGFAHPGLPIWTFQTHPEATPAFLENRGVTSDHDPACFEPGHDLVDGFLRFAARS
jgi:GMP synthase-like glutamine amidotransferase